MSHRALRSVSRVVMLLLLSTPIAAQPKAKRSIPAATAPSLVGTWTGTAKVAFGDSTIVVPVIYTFTETAGAMGGSAVVPGQATGTVSNVTRDGKRVQFRVTPKEGQPLEHDATFGADGALEGTVNMESKPVAKFRITVKPTGGATTKPANSPTTKPTNSPTT